ncbi:MAG: sigma factor, partial [Clostridium perfringens]|nr:sigma factor [Clostridium perfringens]
QIQKGNFENFNIIYNKYYRKIFFFSLKSIGDEKLAEDLTQDVFIDIITNIKNLKEIEEFYSWLLKLVTNKINMMLKKLYLQKKYTLSYNEIFSKLL